jgi:hypothetical protein
MNKFHALVFLALLPTAAWAQDSKLTRTNLSDSLPADVLTAIQNATSTKTIYPVTGNETFRDQILKADEIVFDSGATLTLTGLDKPWIVLIAKRWKFADPKNMVKISRGSRFAGAGSDGSAGTDGLDRPGETNRRGNDGDPGQAGYSGGRGGTSQLPKIYLVGGAFTSPSGDPLPGSLRLTLGFAGIAGGDGGEGGRGGNGGNAGNGKEGATSAFDCKEGPGPGGNGGNAGTGGAGGDGGRGGDGANITYIALADGIEQLSYARVVNVEGYGGTGGRPGRAGKAGNGGGGASSNGWCGPSGPGYPGDFPKPADFGQGENGSDGKKGVVTAITVSSLSPIFKD